MSESALQTDSAISYELLEDRGENVNVKFYTMKEEKYEQSNYLYQVSVGDFSEIEQYNLNACMYYVKSDNMEELCNKVEQQRIALAQCFIKPSDIILADEPTSSLDSETKEIIMKQMKKFHDNGKTIILVTHDSQMQALASRTIQLDASEKIQ